MIKKFIDNPNRKQSFSRNEWLYLLGLIIVGTIIRVAYHHDRPFTNDEVGTLIYIKQNALFILSHFTSWLTMNYFILLEKVLLSLVENNQSILALIPEVSGIITIPLTAILAKMFTSKKTALISATLVTTNAYLISYSGIIRSYSLLAALSLFSIILFFYWFSNRTYKAGFFTAIACFLLMLSHLNGVYTLAYIIILTGMEILDAWVKREKQKTLTLLIPLSISLLFAGLAYIKLVPEIIITGIRWQDIPPTGITYIPYAFATYFAGGFAGVFLALLMLSSFLVAYKQELPSLILFPYIVLSIMLVSLQGISHYPWAYARFLIFLLPICIIFISEGIQFYSSLFSRYKNAISVALTVLILITCTPNLLNSYNKNTEYPWNEAALFIKKSSKAKRILFASNLDQIQLKPYPIESKYPQLQLSEFNEKAYTESKSAKLFFLTSGRPVISNYPKSTFGKIQVITYPSDTYFNQLKMIRSDLIESVRAREVSPELADIYRNIWSINTKLNQYDLETFIYYDLYMRCYQLTERQIYMPIQLR